MQLSLMDRFVSLVAFVHSFAILTTSCRSFVLQQEVVFFTYPFLMVMSFALPVEWAVLGVILLLRQPSSWLG